MADALRFSFKTPPFRLFRLDAGSNTHSMRTIDQQLGGAGLSQDGWFIS